MNIVSKLSPLARMKLYLLSYGIDIDLVNLYDTYGTNLVGYKTKTSKSFPKVEEGRIVEKIDGRSFSIPSEIKISRDGRESIAKVVFRPESPYLLTSDSENCFMRDKNSKRNLDLVVELCKEETCLKSRVCGSTLDNFLSLIGADRISFLLHTGCQNWLTGDQCKFCNLFALSRSRNKVIPNIDDIHSKFSDNISEWWESTKRRYYYCLKKSLAKVASTIKLVPHTHLCLMAGNLRNVSFQWKIAIELANVINEVTPLSQCDSYLNMMPVKSMDIMEEAHQVGFKKVQLNLEVFGENTYKEVCPGKEKTIRYKVFVNSLKYAAEIFGTGNARTNIVLGIQPISRVKEGVIELAHYGVATDYTVFAPKRGTPFEANPTPSIYEVADFTLYLVDIYRKFDFKPIYCPLSSRSSIINEQFYY